jgi:3-oxoacyl-[acyl-carrier protein] reductase
MRGHRKQGSSTIDSLQGRPAIVTGAAVGIGKAIATAFAQRGAHVVIADIDDELGERARAEIERLCGAGFPAGQRPAQPAREIASGPHFIRTDVASATSVDAMVAAVTKRLGRVDILVNNARVDPFRRPPDVTDEAWWDLQMAVDLRGAHLCARAVMPGMKQQRFGRIVNLSSIQAEVGSPPELAAYGAAKAGLIALTRTLAREGAPYNVTANAIAPGTIRTPRITQRATPEQIEATRRRIPLGRLGEPEEVAECAVLLCSVGFITGEVLHIDGGVRLR